MSLRALLLLAMVVTGNSQAFDQSHAKWSQWLKQYCSINGSVTTVNYKAAKATAEPLASYLRDLSGVTKDDFAKWTDPEKLAFLINAYNAFTVQLILQNYPVKSIKDIGGTFLSPWGKKFFKLFGEEQKLDAVEHDMIRKQFVEPRVHFALVCASRGCPPLKNQAYVAENLDAQLEAQARAFLHDPGRNRYDAKENKLYLSKIFQWYAEDFRKKNGTVQMFVAPRIANGQAEELKMRTAEVDTSALYDWALNETL